MRKTKIICTLGPKTVGLYEELINNGMDAARVNFSHETHEIHASRINDFKKAREKLGKPVPLIMDTKGPEFRIGVVEEGTFLTNGDEFSLVNKEFIGNKSRVSFLYDEIYEALETGVSLLIDDGRINLKVKHINDDCILCEVICGGALSNRKGVNIPNLTQSFSFLSDSDMDDIIFAIKHDFDTIALSFVSSSENIILIRDILDKHGRSDMKIIAKIENLQAVENIDDIITHADGIMIGRGDLGIELSLEEVPKIQKKLIRKCYSRGKPVITATQMLESMTENMQPTRAEVSDVANAIYDGTSAVMLSGETAMGKDPVNVVKRMVDIIICTENDIDYRDRFYREDWLNDMSIVNVIGQAATVAAFELSAKAIVVITNSGNTARMISKYRPVCPIIAVTVKPIIERQMNMSWGIQPVKTKYIEEINELLKNTIECAKSTKLVETGDIVVLVSGMPTGYSGKTNLMKIHKVGEELL